MTKKDNALINTANALNCTEGYMILPLIKKADSEQTKKTLNDIRKALYYKEERYL